LTTSKLTLSNLGAVMTEKNLVVAKQKLAAAKKTDANYLTLFNAVSSVRPRCCQVVVLSLKNFSGHVPGR
jgi:hypothetical protein